jgi:hypothetical protein
MPARTKMPITARLSDPAPPDSTSGKAPKKVAMLVIRIGRNRVAAASITASRRPTSDSARRWLAKSTIRIAFFASRPVKSRSPICEKVLTDCPVTRSAPNPPASARGTATMIVTGWTKDSSRPARTR